MSASENAAVVQTLYESFGRRDMQELLSLLADDVIWEAPAIPGVAASGRFQGHEGVRSFFEALAENEEVQTVEPQQWLTNEDAVAVVGRAVGKVRSTGKPFDLTFVHLYKLSDGKIVSFRDYYDSHLVAEAYRP